MTIPEVQSAPESELWWPGKHLDDHYPTPSSDELVALWQEYSPGEAVATSEVFGVLSVPQKKVKAIVSLDLCEVMRQTVVALDKALGKETPQSRSSYQEGLWFDPAMVDKDYERSVIVSMVRTLMHARLVDPHDDAEQAAEYMRVWNEQGVYVVANTSTLPGCEPSTIADFTRYKLGGCINGLLLPRNHDGKGSITKAKAISLGMADIGLDPQSLPLIHIDDAPHHATGFELEFRKHTALGLYVPQHHDNNHAPLYMHVASVADAFSYAHRFLKEEGILV